MASKNEQTIKKISTVYLPWIYVKTYLYFKVNQGAVLNKFKKLKAAVIVFSQTSMCMFVCMCACVCMCMYMYVYVFIWFSSCLTERDTGSTAYY
jgi:hypothetical protein